jgi:REP element-mobilizing transposase RayT
MFFSFKIKSFAHNVGVNAHHFELCILYRYNMFMKEGYKKFCKEALQETAARHNQPIKKP